MSDLVRVAVDAMGGDYAPVEPVKGAVEAVNADERVKVQLVGQVDVIEKELQKYTYPKERVEIVPATEIIETGEPPVNAIRHKKDSSIVVGMKKVRCGEADAFVSSGSTGAVLVGGQTIVGRIKGVERPPLAPLIPTKDGVSLLIDCGANVDARPSHLVQFAMMGSIYMEHVVGIKNPRVGIVNIGVEETKGTELQVEAYGLMKEAGYNFIGNVEAREVPLGGCDVAVCDGFTGNIILKTTEGLAKLFMSEIKGIFMKSLPNKLAAAVVKKDLGAFKKKFDSAEYGGALLLGTKKPVIKAHGSSDAKAFYNAIRQAISCCENNIIGEMESQLAVEAAEAE